MKKRVKVGEIGVDAGMVWVGDPCYFWPRERGEQQPAIDRIGSWSKMGDRFFSGEFPYRHNFDGLGVAVTSGYGDGEYPVYVNVEDGRITSLTVVFVEDNEE